MVFLEPFVHGSGYMSSRWRNCNFYFLLLLLASILVLEWLNWIGFLPGVISPRVRYKYQMDGNNLYYIVHLATHLHVSVSPYVIHIILKLCLINYELFLSRYLQPMSSHRTLQPSDQGLELPSCPQERESSQAWKSGRSLIATLLGKTYCTSQSGCINRIS